MPLKVGIIFDHLKNPKYFSNITVVLNETNLHETKMTELQLLV